MGFYSSSTVPAQPRVRLFVVMAGCETLPNRAVVWWPLAGKRWKGMKARGGEHNFGESAMYRMRVCDSLRRAWDSNWDSKRQSPVVICRTSGAGTICTLPCHPQPQSELGKSTVKLSLAAWVDLFESIIDSRHISWRFYYYTTQNLLSQLDSTLVKVESSQKIWLSWVKCQP